MKLKIEFSCDNDAFEENAETEISVILRRIERDILNNFSRGSKIRDVNGNTIGTWTFED